MSLHTPITNLPDLQMRPRRVAGMPSAPQKGKGSSRTPVPNPKAGDSQLSPHLTEPIDAPPASNSSPNQAGATLLPPVHGKVDTQAEGPSLTPGEDPNSVPDASGQEAPDPVLPPDKPPDAITIDAPDTGALNLPPPDPGGLPDPSTGPDPVVVVTTHECQGIHPDLAHTRIHTRTHTRTRAHTQPLHLPHVPRAGRSVRPDAPGLGPRVSCDFRISPEVFDILWPLWEDEKLTSFSSSYPQ